jgi:hypothetical protein
MSGRHYVIAGALAAFAAFVTACSSDGGSSAPVPGVTEQGLSSQSYRCVDSTPAKKSELSRALHRQCCCAAKPHHIAGQPDNIFVEDCSHADAECVNDVLDTNGYRNPPWSATIVSYSPCMPLAVSYDPCGGICRNNPGGGGGGSGGAPGDDGDGDDDGHCGR